MRPFVIVIEGCDKCGKTSLAKRLRDRFDWPIVKCSQPKPGGAVAEYMSAIANQPGPFIADRFHLGESVYGPIYRGTPRLDGLDCRAIEDQLIDRGSLLVLMEDRPDRIAERFKRLGESFARASDITRILVDFELEWRRSRLAKIRATWDDGLPDVVAAVAMYMGAK